MNRFNFWQQWLFYTSIGFALFGVVLACFGDNPLFHYYNQALAKIFWQQEELPEAANRFRAFVSGPLGGTIACCYTLTAFIAWYPFAKKEKWAWWAIAVSYTIWMVLDSTVCWYYGVHFQVYLINLFSVVVKLLPLVMTWKYFNKEETAGR
jgi:hypothetical protein